VKLLLHNNVDNESPISKPLTGIAFQGFSTIKGGKKLVINYLGKK
jgi:hypothetical protein